MAKVIPFEGGTFRLPSLRDRLVNIGETGSGKSWAAIWHLSNANFETRPYVIIDPKNEDDIATIDAEEIEVGYVPKAPGMYVMHPFTRGDMQRVDDFFMDCWAKENIGIYLDEAMFCVDGDGLTAVLTQGRSKRIPMIINTQRPVELNRLAFNQASFFQVFPFNDKREMKTINNFFTIPELYKGEPLPNFWSHYRDIQMRSNYVLRPVPPVTESVARINARLEAMRDQQVERQYARRL
jgi:hypothetical protein